MSNEDSKKQTLETRKLHGTPYQVIVQKHHAYNLDTILLAHFASSRIKKSKKIVDLGTGNGILMLYLSLYTHASLTGYDITASHIEIANQNIEINQLDHQIKAIHKDITTIESFDCDTIITNPPYFKYQEHTNISKHPKIHNSVADTQRKARSFSCLSWKTESACSINYHRWAS